MRRSCRIVKNIKGFAEYVKTFEKDQPKVASNYPQLDKAVKLLRNLDGGAETEAIAMGLWACFRTRICAQSSR